MRHIKDAVHGYIKLNDEEEKIVDSPALQRLRCIKQLDFASLVYPSANHTRFEHTLGTTYLAGKFAESLDLDEDRRNELRTAALLHDSGHGPFSHAGEMIAKKNGISHEDFSCETAERIGHLYSADTERVVKIIRGELEIGQVVCSDVDADRMDYLMRDSHYSGLNHGQIDSETIIRLAEIDSRRLVYNEKSIQALESLLTSRFHMYKTLYMHRTVCIASKMVQRALEYHMYQGNELERLMRLDDYSAHCELMNSEHRSQELYSRIRNRKLYKNAFELGINQLSKNDLRKLAENIREPMNLEKELADKCGIDMHEVIVDLPTIPKKEELNVRIKSSEGIVNLNDASPIPDSLVDAEWRHTSLNIYTSKENATKVEKHSKDILRDYIDLN